MSKTTKPERLCKEDIKAIAKEVRAMQKEEECAKKEELAEKARLKEESDRKAMEERERNDYLEYVTPMHLFISTVKYLYYGAGAEPYDGGDSEYDSYDYEDHAKHNPAEVERVRAWVEEHGLLDFLGPAPERKGEPAPPFKVLRVSRNNKR